MTREARRWRELRSRLGAFARSRPARAPVVAILLATLLPILVLLPLLVSERALTRSLEADARLDRIAGRESQRLEIRLDSAIALLDRMIAEPADVGLRGIARTALATGMFDDVVLQTEPARGMPLTPMIFSEPVTVASPDGTGARAALRVSVALGEGPGTIAAVRARLDPRWLWRDLDAAGTSLMVLDDGGRLLWASAELPAQVLGVAAAVFAPGGAVDLPTQRWQAAGREWHARAVRIDPAAARESGGARWRIVALEERSSAVAAVASASPWATLALGLLLLLCFVPGLALLAGFAAARVRIVDRTRALAALDLRPRLQAPPRAAALPGANALDDIGNQLEAARVRVADELTALALFGEMDRLMLGAQQLEVAVDELLSRLQTVTCSHAVGLAMLDADSPVHGRVFASHAGGVSLPVARAAFHPDFLTRLRDCPDGLTVLRCEEERHGFLEPLREVGAQFFWIWPVTVGDRLAAAMIVGFVDEPVSDPRFAGRGAAFADRVGVLLERSERDETLYRQAHFDPLTGLANRLLFRERLATAIESARSDERSGALLYIDLDHFKRVNDSVGHAAGDQLLVIVAQRLRSCVKDTDVIARLAGDEFAVVLASVSDPESAAIVADRIITALAAPVNVAGRDHYVQASVGIAIFPADGTTVDELVRNADGAMYRAKELGRGRSAFFDRRLAEARFETSQSGLYRALRRREFSLYYQPQYDAATGRLVALEALLRWQTPREGLRHPAEFIPAAETSGLISDIGAWVLEAACSQFSVWREQGIAPSRLSVNVSAQQLKSAEFPRLVRRILDRFSLPASVLELELTETVFADEITGHALRQLRELGLRLALDDFGTGYSSLNYLRQHPIDVVKIDRSFLEDVPHNASSATLVSTIVTMAHALGKEVVAEGVETAEQLDFLREWRCDLAQGFFLSRPLTVTATEELLQSARVAESPSDLRRTG